MGGQVSTGTSSTQLNNKDVNRLLSTLSKGANSLYTPGGTNYVAPSDPTTSSWQQMLGASGNPDFSGGIAGALQSYANRAAGNEIGTNDPAYAAVRDKLQNDITTSVNSSFNNSGLFGSDSNSRGLAEGLASGLGGLDLQQLNDSYARQTEAATLLPQLLQSSLMPSSITGAVGSEMDADAAAKAGGQIDYLNNFMSILNGAAGASGTTTTESMPLWRALLGTASTVSGMGKKQG